MPKVNKITLLVIGDEADRDSFKKLHKEKKLITASGFDYANLNYKQLLNNNIPDIKTEKVIIFLFFPYSYWDKKIESKNYKGIYGNETFYKKFMYFWKLVDSSVKKYLPDKNISFITTPFICGRYRDKLFVKKIISKADIPAPKLCNSTVKDIHGYLNKGSKLFLKVKYGSMGKGITFLSFSKWLTNFTYRNKKILSRKSDTGWGFKNVTGNDSFLRDLLKKDVYIEKAVNFLPMGRKKFDFRIYTFFNKVLYVYPRSNDAENIITNITQSGKGEPQKFLRKIPKRLVDSSKKLALKTTKALGLSFAGVDIMLDRDLENMYVLDVNVFPGFPKRRMFNLSRRLVQELERLNKKSLPGS